MQDWITNLNHPNVVYCDVFAAMADNDGYARSELVVPDGVHFTIKGNQTVGETIAAKIMELVNQDLIHFS